MRSIVAITAAATATALTTSGAVAAELSPVVVDDSAYLDRLINQASAAIVAYLRVTLASESVVEIFRDIAGDDHLPLARRPATAIASIVVDGVTLVAAEWELGDEDSTLYRLRTDARTRWTAAKIVVAYTAGYLLPGQAGANLPADIERACILTAASFYQARGLDARLRSESVDGVGSQSWLDPRTAHGPLPWQAAELLQPHRRWP